MHIEPKQMPLILDFTLPQAKQNKTTKTQLTFVGIKVEFSIYNEPFLPLGSPKWTCEVP